MATSEEFRDSLTSFAQSCNDNTRLQAIIKDWNRVLHVQAADIGDEGTLTTQGGTVDFAPVAPPRADLLIQSTAEILTQVFYGEVSPNEPYNAGTLRIQGAENDIVRLDFVIAMLWE